MGKRTRKTLRKKKRARTRRQRGGLFGLFESSVAPRHGGPPRPGSVGNVYGKQTLFLCKDAETRKIKYASLDQRMINNLEAQKNWCKEEVKTEIAEVGPPPELTSPANQPAKQPAKQPASETASTDPCAGVELENKADILKGLAIGTQYKNKKQIEQFIHLLNCYNMSGKHKYVG